MPNKRIRNSQIPEIKKGIRWMKVSKLILIAFPSIVFGIFTIVFSLEQKNFTKMIREQDQKQTDELNIRTVFQNYINDMTKVLFRKSFNQTNTEDLLHIRVKTLTALNYLDTNRKRDIILFLYEAQLLRSDRNKLDLTGANLNDLQFVGSSNSPILLDYLYLSGIKATNLVFQWCQLNNAIFDYSFLPNMKLINVAIANTSFREIYSPDSLMQNSITHRNNFSGSILCRMHFITNVYIRASIDFTNTDLIDSTLTYDDEPIDLTEQLIDSLIIIRNTRFPDGSFPLIDSKDLIVDGNTEEMCQSNNSDLKSWQPNGDIPMMEVSSMKMNSTHPILSEERNCYFLAQVEGESSLVQLINVKSFSVLIDSEQGRLNASAYLGCVQHKYANVSILFTFLSDNGISTEQFGDIETKNTPNIMIDIHDIPPLTRFIRLSLHSYSIGKTGYCIIDNIQLSIFESKGNVPTKSSPRIFDHQFKKH